ncbi:MAG: Uma2 family endonuclease [Gemmataceae bacterium]|nr:Uma2 family endonuclease [Gemmataceae bacterium]
MSTVHPASPPAVPPLRPGDRLTCAEFERRYEAMPHVKKAELIEGVVFIPSPVRVRRHGKPHGIFILWLGTFNASTPGTLFADNTTTRLDDDNEYQPDGLLMIDPEWGGQAVITTDDYIEFAPELVGEISASSASFDLHTKKTVYRRNGVREYIVWSVLDKKIDWFVLRSGEFESLQPDEQGILKSEVFSGLWLDVAALLSDDLRRVLAVLHDGLGSPEHAEFVERLGQQKQ